MWWGSREWGVGKGEKGKRGEAWCLFGKGDWELGIMSFVFGEPF